MNKQVESKSADVIVRRLRSLPSIRCHLRTCQTCGVTLCCDSSPNRHASKHAHDTGHPVIASAQPTERWLYCYPDDVFAEY